MAIENTYHIDTYGCQMNAHDSERIAGMLESMGYSAAPVEDAALIVVNTCCVRQSAQTKIMGNIGALKRWRDSDHRVRIIVCGCMTEQSEVRNTLSNRYRFVDGVFSTNDLSTLTELLGKLRFAGNRSFSLDYDKMVSFEQGPYVRKTYPLSFVNIMYGCNNFCSYCIVPYVRGRERSREPDSVIDEIRALADSGYSEVTLLGQNVNSYGGGNDEFARLLLRIANETQIPRIRFMTSHPKDLTPALIAAFRDIPALMPHIHLPVQSGSDRILRLMNRRYDRAHYLALIDELRAARPNIAVTTDIIVGFPTETEEDFADTADLVQRVRYDAAFTFIYSKRIGTVAAGMDGQVPIEIKRERIKRLIGMQDDITLQKNEATVGGVCPVLVEGLSTRSENEVCGRTPNFKMVNFSGGSELVGNIVNVRITKANRTTLSGERADG